MLGVSEAGLQISAQRDQVALQLAQLLAILVEKLMLQSVGL